MYRPIPGEIFHVHTWRCKHAGEEKDFEYVEKAIALGASRIVFTDHGPFPGNPFGKRMDIEKLPEYVETLKGLKKEYASEIEVLIGLELEYLPSFHSFYKELRDSGDFDVLMIGQHFCENADGSFSFAEEERSKEHIGLCDAIVMGAVSGYFDVIAHPDRAFYRCKEWNEEMLRASVSVIEAAKNHNLILERNYSSMERKYQYWEQFWQRSDGAMTLGGYDVHSVEEMTKIWNTRKPCLR